MAAKELFSLGKLYPSDFLKPGEEPRCEPIELKLIMEDNGLVHLEKTAPKEAMWGEKYWYRSSISDTMKRQLNDVVASIHDVYDLKPGMAWLDIAGNDGYLLSQVSEDFIKINVDPANDSFKDEAEDSCDLVIQDYFSADVFKKSPYGYLKPNVVTVISMFYDLSEPGVFLDDVYEIIDNDGLLCLQLSYSPLMIEQLEFSNLCHEHTYYYSFFNLKDLLEKHSFRVMDVSLNDTNAGSFRVYAMKENADTTKFGSQTHRDVCDFRVRSLSFYENILAIDEPDVWEDFFERINLLKQQTVSFIKAEKEKGKVIMGYGASTKFNTTLQYFGLTNELITAIADRSPEKHGLVTAGSNIPIISEDQMRLQNPDFLLIGPSHFLSEFIEREKIYLVNGGCMISIMPKFYLIRV